MTDYNWLVIDNNHMAKMLQAEVQLRGNNSFFDALLIEASHRIEAAEAEAAALREQLATAQATIQAMRDNIAEIEQNREASQAHWHDPYMQRVSDFSDDDTPLGQALDGLGDEVE